MNILGLSVNWARVEKQQSLQNVDHNRGWFNLIRESFAGAWQHNVEVNFDSVLSHHTDFACRTLIASDIAKLRIKLVQFDDANEVWSEVKNPAYSPVLRKPNPYQNRIQFLESWVLSKLQRGNTYVLKGRDGRGIVNRLYVLDPQRCWPLVADDGSVYYELQTDNLTGITSRVIVPAREIIHDRFNCFFHPLVGLSPIFAGGLAATHGMSILKNAIKFFRNGSQPGGVLTAPAKIDPENAKRLKEYWEENFTGSNAGRIAVLGDGLKYDKFASTAVESQMIEQLKYSAEVVCSTYHVPPYKVGVGVQPSYNNVQALNTEYYSQCLQRLIEDIELCLDEGLGIGDSLGTELDVDNLLRMDSVSLMEMLKNANGIMSPNEQRQRVNLPPAEGGKSPMLQQQNYSLAALAKRDASDDPFKSNSPPPQQPAPAAATDGQGADDTATAEGKGLTAAQIGEAAKAFLYAEFAETKELPLLPKPLREAAE